MAFRELDFTHLARFNSALSCDFLDQYENFIDDTLIEKLKEPSHKTFAPSAFRCDRRSWFRLRGVDPDVVASPDRVLDFSAKIGTACHKMIQMDLKSMLGDDWINVDKYVHSFSGDGSNYTCESDPDGLETLITIVDPPVRFACDGIVRLNDRLYLLEIKSSEYSAWSDLTDPKSKHIDQVKCYCTLLHLDDVLFLYIDRQYGGLKCFEVNVTSSDKLEILRRFQTVQQLVEQNIAPDPLPSGDSWCTPSMCPYYVKCKEYGR